MISPFISAMRICSCLIAFFNTDSEICLSCVFKKCKSPNSAIRINMPSATLPFVTPSLYHTANERQASMENKLSRLHTRICILTSFLL